ncbi:MAG: DUF721 domain-containing protein [Nitrospirae bacterium]|nr:DUF721 domain-containing protein [Nitrospirota bacterium]
MQRVGNILRQFVKDYGLESSLKLQAIKKQWAGIVGATVAAHASPDLIKGKTIFIAVDTPQWMHHLSFYKQEISEKLRHHNIEDIRFKLGKPDKNPDIEQGVPRSFRLSKEDYAYIEDTISSLKDAGLREKFRTLLTHGLTKKK